MAQENIDEKHPPLDIPAGSWSDGGATDKGFEDRIARENSEARQERLDYINALLSSGTVNQELASLLKEMRTSTGGASEAVTRDKVRLAIEFREELKQAGVANGKTAYIGAGVDWRMAVALGAGDIDLVDPDYERPETRAELINGLKTSYPDAKVSEDELKISIQANLGEGLRKITLQLIPKSVDRYIPPPLAAVLEFKGPTKNFLIQAPVLPNIAASLQPGAVIVNYDYYYAPAAQFHDRGIALLPRGDLAIARVENQERLVEWSKQTIITGRPLPKFPSS